MLQNNIFTMYDKKYNKLIDGYVYSKPKFCEKCFSDPNKKCHKFYDKLDIKQNNVYTCPYGLSTIVFNENIFTSLFIKENMTSKTTNNFKEDIKNNHKFTQQECETLIKKSIERDLSLERYRETVHDLRNMASYFNSMIDDYNEEKGGQELTSTEMSLISLYELINFRLDVLYGKVDLTDIIEKEQKLHPIVVKLYYILRYKARQKGIKVNISNRQDNYFNITKSLYLALFILMENSIKYSLPNNEININFIEDEKHSDIIISNITSKMNELNGNDLIQKGVRGSNAVSLGSGIGLAFANELLENMGSKLTIAIKKLSDKKSLFEAKITLYNVSNYR